MLNFCTGAYLSSLSFLSYTHISHPGAIAYGKQTREETRISRTLSRILQSICPFITSSVFIIHCKETVFYHARTCFFSISSGIRKGRAVCSFSMTFLHAIRRYNLLRRSTTKAIGSESLNTTRGTHSRSSMRMKGGESKHLKTRPDELL